MTFQKNYIYIYVGSFRTIVHHKCDFITKHQYDGRCSAESTNPPSNLLYELRTFKVNFRKFPTTPIRRPFIQALQFERKYVGISSHQMNADESLN